MNILYVEDSMSDIVLLNAIINETEGPHQLIILRDGQEAKNYLEDLILENDRALPNLIVLDINLPSINGLSLLNYIKGHEKLARIPVVLFSDSISDLDEKTKEQTIACISKSSTYECILDNFRDVIALVNKEKSY